MAQIQERLKSDGSKSYRVRIRIHGHPPATATFDRMTDAKRWATQTEAAIREGRYFKNVQSRKRTLSEAIDKYIDEHLLPSGQPSTTNRLAYLRTWKELLGEHALSAVTPALLSETRNKHIMNRTNQFGRKINQTTANRYTQALGHVFTIALKEWEWVQDNPVSKLRKFKESRGRVRFLSDDERERLLSACQQSTNPHLYLIVVLALSTGARKNEIVGMEWKDVDLDRERVTLHHTKNGERRTLHIKGTALELLKKHACQRNPEIPFVFPSATKKKPIEITTAWETARERAEIEDFRFHDLRHSAASYLAMNGATIQEIAEVLGHKTLQMVKRYAHLAETHTAKVVERMNQRVFQ
jgi:integrase